MALTGTEIRKSRLGEKAYRLTHDQALAKVMQHLLKDDTQVYKQFLGKPLLLPP